LCAPSFFSSSRKPLTRLLFLFLASPASLSASTTAGYRPTLKVYGKSVTQSRQIAAYATDPELTVKYSGHPVDMHYEWPPVLQRIKEKVEKELGVMFNHCMLNFYENGT
jgi:alkylated DNA repair dioxygenase AlkB